jgi:hypothetical protein
VDQIYKGGIGIMKNNDIKKKNIGAVFALYPTPDTII